MKIEGQLASHSHPSGDHNWHFTPECLAKMAEQLPGVPVRVNFQGEPIGFVDSATCTEEGVKVSVSILAGGEAKICGDTLSPSFVARDQAWNADFSCRDIGFAEVNEIGLTED